MDERSKIQQINIEDYDNQKKEGKIAVQKVGSAILMVKSRWNPDTGRPADPQVVPLTSAGIRVAIEQLEEQKKKMDETILLHQKLLADVAELEGE